MKMVKTRMMKVNMLRLRLRTGMLEIKKHLVQDDGLEERCLMCWRRRMCYCW